jgi:hypothetical protein
LGSPYGGRQWGNSIPNRGRSPYSCANVPAGVYLGSADEDALTREAQISFYTIYEEALTEYQSKSASRLGKAIYSISRDRKHANTRETNSRDKLAHMWDIPIRHDIIKSSLHRHDIVLECSLDYHWYITLHSLFTNQTLSSNLTRGQTRTVAEHFITACLDFLPDTSAKSQRQKV